MSFNYMEKFSVAGKKCIVTGGAQGLSAAWLRVCWKTALRSS